MGFLEWLSEASATVTATLIGGFAGAYLAAKAKNLATKEDIEAITAKVEGVKVAFDAQREDLQQQNRLRIAALERRLETHQAGYALWWTLKSRVHTKDPQALNDIVIECQDWWVHHNLYLGVNARAAFHRAYLTANAYPELKRIAQETRDPGHSQALRDAWDIIERAGAALAEAVALPPIVTEANELEAKGTPTETR